MNLRISLWCRHSLQNLLQIVAVAILCACIGCASHQDRAVLVRDSFYAGDIQTALQQTDPAEHKNKHDADVTKLNRAMIQLADGQPAQAERTLREVRDRFDYLEQKSLAEQAAALVTDDRQISYNGEDYEKILIRVMLALSNLMDQGGDVHAYALQVVAKQQELLAQAPAANGQVTLASEATPESNSVLDYSSVAAQLAIGSYLRAAVLESSPLDYDDVTRCRVQVANWQPGFRDAKIDLARAETGRHSAPGHGVVYLFSLVGPGPYKQQQSAPATSVSLLIADRILSAAGKYELPPTIAPVKIPVAVRAPQNLEAIEVSANGTTLGRTATIMNVAEFAVEQNRLARDQVIARAVARRIVKKAAVYAVKDGLNVEQAPAADLLLTIAGVAWEASEQADTRCWSLLPDRIQVLRLELPAGQHELMLTPVTTNQTAGRPTSVTVNVQDAKTSFLLGNFPVDRAVGKIQVSQAR